MKICFISKYPPIEGGISSRTYWLVKALGERGHEVHLVTNAWEVEDKYRENIEFKDLNGKYQPKNVFVHNTVSSQDNRPVSLNPGYIPYANPYTAKLAGLAIDVIKKYKLELIDSWYILPYGIAGFLAKQLTGKPQILRHAGSDIYRLMKNPFLKTLFVSIFKKTDKIVTGYQEKEVFLSQGVPGSKLVFNRIHNVCSEAFNPGVKKYQLTEYFGKKVAGIPVITFIGKIARDKGVFELAEAASKLKGKFFLLFVANGAELSGLKDRIAQLKIKDKALFMDFVPPWDIPGIIKSSSAVLMLERDFPIARHYSILPREVLAVGKCLVISKELYKKGYYGKMQNGKHAVIVDPKDTANLAACLQKIIDRPSEAGKIGKAGNEFLMQLSDKLEENFDAYVDQTVLMYERILRSGKKRP